LFPIKNIYTNVFQFNVKMKRGEEWKEGGKKGRRAGKREGNELMKK